MFLLIPTPQRLPCPYTILQIVSYAYFKLLSFYKSEITLNCVLTCFFTSHSITRGTTSFSFYCLHSIPFLR